MKKSLYLIFIVWLSLTHLTSAETTLQIEVFDVTQSKVVKSIPLDESNKNEAIQLIRSVDALFPKLNPTPRSGIMIKVPFEPSISVETDILTQPVKEVIFIFPEAERPYMLIFNDRNQPMFYYFKRDSTEFLRLLDISNSN